ncbi:dipeptide/oligopeptide/nickel ABC transporter permease/ATP-binding protein [Microbacterium protaetiae]|uniref:Dipeptide/oligopeptide/nickel ABC transporter permease/ATP-binding protein n=1 Tax=Microbacterium protaetiae TaxID=2509458 RepID=A0A4P6EQZ6_9MICO|nr:dipeptide/oligopeptide/nickel ABC transporter permease/ATP-binding protein [Microbacterium protaetiae]QAY60298.1 dipeptide/oligopeptide/nickel ABC transporter permease/ATP-binding protein [Microbacterium protaetiae]
MMTSRAYSASLTCALLRKPLGVVAAAVIALLVLSALLAPWLSAYDPTAQDIAAARQGPSAAHWLGTDLLGRDLLTRLMYGGRDSLLGVAEALIVMLIIAVPIGILAAYLRGTFDRAVLAVIDIVMSIPAILITLASLAIFSNSMFAAMVTIGILASAAFARVFRSTVLAQRQAPFVQAAVVTGLPTARILLRHVLPQARGTILVQSSLFAAATLGIQTGLSFLAFGPPPPAPTWGGMVAEAASAIQSFPWMFVPTGGVIVIATLALGLLGDALRDAAAEQIRRPRRGAGTARSAASAAEVDDARTASAADAVLAVHDLSVAFGADEPVTVVDRVSFDVRRGEILGIVGESGSGKTVTALAAMGLLGRGGRVTGGGIVFEGQEISADAAAMKAVRGSGIAYISQEPLVALDPSFTVGFQLVEVVRRHDRCPRRQARQRALELLAAMRLPDPERVFRSHPHQISGGMAQRVVIAKALAGRPRLLIADEPTTALDVTVQAEILSLLSSIREDTGMSIILVTHDWGVVAQTCDRTLVMYAGQVVEEAMVSDLIRSPRHPYTRGLLGSDPHGARRGDILPTIGGVVPPPGAWPHGCRFADRCFLARPECRAMPIAMTEVGDDRVSRCIRVDELVEAATA